MRMLTVAAALAALAFAQSASAAIVTVAPVSFSPEFQTALDEDLGAREGGYLQRRVEAVVSRALERAGAQIGPGGQLSVEIAIIDADPNRPTMQQAVERPGLDTIRSFSVGGAELHAVIRGAGGQALAEVSHRYYSPSLDYVFTPADQWSDANRAINTFARKVADEYRARAN